MRRSQPYARHGLPWQHRTRPEPSRGLRLPVVLLGLSVVLAGLGLAFGYAAPRPQPLAAPLSGGPVGAAVSVALQQSGSEAAPAGAQAGPPQPEPVPPASVLQRAWAADPGEGISYDPELASRLDAALAGVDGRIGVAVKDLGSGRGAALDASRELPSASLFKVPVLYAVFQADLPFNQQLLITDEIKSFDLGTLELGAGETLSVAEALERMVTISDNASAILLANAVGPNRVNTDMALLGLDRTHYSAERLTSSAGDMLDLLERIARGTAVSRGASADMLHLLLRQRVNDRLPRLLPDEARVAHKTGNLPGIVNDVGIVYGPHSTLIVAGMIVDTTDEGGAADGLARLALAAYTYFEARPEQDDRPRIPPPPNRPVPPVWRQPRPPPAPTPTPTLAPAPRPEPTPEPTPSEPTPTAVPTPSAVAVAASAATPRPPATPTPAPTARPAAPAQPTPTPVPPTPAPTAPPRASPPTPTAAQPTTAPRGAATPQPGRTPAAQATGTAAPR